MATQKQVKANRQNALRSTGPKTSVGKTISSVNSIRHGFYSTTVLLPGEDREEYLRLARRIVLAYQPSGILEEEEVRSIVETRWQLRRATRVDSELFQMYGFSEGEQRGVGTAFAQDAVQGNAFTKLTRYQGFLLRMLQVAQKELQRLQTARASRTPMACRDVPSVVTITPDVTPTIRSDAEPENGATRREG
jgi:hypothetical protein